MIENGRSLSQVVADLRAEVKDFAQTRFDMLRAEMSEKFARMKASLPLLLIGALLAAVAFLVLTATFVVAIAAAIEGPLAWLWATLAVGLAYLIVGFLALWLGYREFSRAGLKPERTLRVLEQDQAWLQQEARTQL